MNNINNLKTYSQHGLGLLKLLEVSAVVCVLPVQRLDFALLFALQLHHVAFELLFNARVLGALLLRDLLTLKPQGESEIVCLYIVNNVISQRITLVGVLPVKRVDFALLFALQLQIFNVLCFAPARSFDL